ncbi:MAG: hypothetical protein KF798_00285 [Candidatus Paracaedibacteraceae bacterium]|nr:hypothetical protein [Candidatus Paracaedibacteraceae bacterium]
MIKSFIALLSLLTTAISQDNNIPDNSWDAMLKNMDHYPVANIIDSAETESSLETNDSTKAQSPRTQHKDAPRLSPPSFSKSQSSPSPRVDPVRFSEALEELGK